MINKKTLVIFCLIIALFHHFIFYFGEYGPSLPNSIFRVNSVLGLFSVLVMFFVYIGTNWRIALKGHFILTIFDLLIVWILICYCRSLLTVHGKIEWREILFSPYMGLSLFPVLYFIVGINLKYFSTVNILLSIYCIVAWLISLLFMKHTEFQVFILLPVFYMIITSPFKSSRYIILTLIITINIVIVSLTNRAGVVRLGISYMIVIFYYFIYKFKISRKIISVLVLSMLLTPLFFIYIGISGKNVFSMVIGNIKGGSSQESFNADTRTFLYREVFQDLNANKAYVFGKGINAGYASYSFETLKRDVVEVGFLQIMLKSGIVGFLLYMTVIISAIFKALNRSKNLFMEYLALLLAAYVLLFFIENILAYNLLNIVIWMVVGMCHSEELRGLNDHEIKELLMKHKQVAPSE